MIQLGIDQAIAFFNLNGDDAPFAHIAVIRKIGFLDDARLRGEYDVEIFIPRLIDGIRSSSGFL